MEAIVLTPQSVDLIRREAERGFPEEVCGFLFGMNDDDTRDVTEAKPIQNVQASNRARRFLINPEEFQRAERYAFAQGLELLGFYHSHPDHPAIPSDYDRVHALPFYSYVIVSVTDGKATELRSWQLDPDRKSYREEPVEIKAEFIP